jgi:hypothetical protein
MSGGSTIVGPWPNRDAEAPVADDAFIDHAEPVWAQDAYYAETEKQSIGLTIAKLLCVLSAISWVGFSLWTHYIALNGAAPTLQGVAAFLPVLATPLILIGLIWIMFVRSAKAESAVITKTINDLRAEEARFGLILESFAGKIDEGRAAIVEQNDLLMTLGHEAAQRLGQISDSVRNEVDGIARHSASLKSSASSARADMAVLLSDLPKAQVQTRQMTAALQQAGLIAHEKAGALDAQLASLTARGREAEEIAGGAAQKLAAHLARMEGVSEVAGARMADAAGEMTGAVDAALERAADALASSRQGMEAQGAAMLALIEQGQAAMARTGAQSIDSIAQKMTDINERVESIAHCFADQDAQSQAMLDRISQDVARIEDRVAALGHGATRTSEQASTALAALHEQAGTLATTLDSSGKTADAMIARAETLLLALNATTREMDETLPASYDRLQKIAADTQAATQIVTPHFEALERSSAQTLAQVNAVGDALQTQRDNMDQLVTATSESLAVSQTTADTLVQSLDSFEAKARSLTEATGPQLVEALLRVKETANQAAEHARVTIHEAIPTSADGLTEKSRDALATMLAAQVEGQIKDIVRTTEGAVQAAQKATDRLMRQMLTISETTATLEARVTDAKEEIAKSDEGGFARRVSLMIESLNSTAIDVTKLLSNEVTDTAWAAYLRGDRGVFTRRAVRLLEAGEVREVAKSYDEDTEFREQVNRYIHDFEGMIRNVLATRDGGPLSVTLLSSDAGKLYVALAQAIDRLRT